MAPSTEGFWGSLGQHLDRVDQRKSGQCWAGGSTMGRPGWTTDCEVFHDTTYRPVKGRRSR
ncbi:MAG TPA: hypothetical protein VJ838_15095 [Gaiellaceae bacterium]|nr:hypothetical protein [Gaiellaceae bacterium]